MASRVVTQSSLSDLNPGSALTHFLGTVAAEVETVELRLRDIRNQFSITKSSGTDLDDRVADLPLGGIERGGAVSAVGDSMKVTFSEALANPLVIPSGTRFASSNDSSIEYATVADVVIPAGLTEYPTAGNLQAVGLRVRCLTPGDRGNVGVGVVTLINSAPSEIVGCTNIYPISGGLDAETDEMLRERAVAYLAALSRITSAALKYVVMSFTASTGETFRNVGIYEDPELPGFTEVLVDVGQGGFLPQSPTANQSYVRDGNETTFEWIGMHPSVLYHEMAALKHLTESNLMVYAWSSPALIGNIPVAGPAKWLPLSDPAVKAAYGIPANYDPVIDIPERGTLYLDSNFPIENGLEYSVTDSKYVVSSDKAAKLLITDYQVYTGAIAEIQSVIEGDPSDPGKFPGYRPAGCRVRVAIPTVHFIDQGMTVDITTAPGIALVDIEADIKDHIVDVVHALGPGESLRLAAITSRLFQLESIENVVIEKPVSDVSPPSRRHVLRINPDLIVLQ